MDCVPPWLSSNNHCQKNIKIFNHSKDYITDMIEENFVFPRYKMIKPTQAEQMCKNPCKTNTN